MKKTCTPIVLPYGAIARHNAGMVVAPLHQLLIPLTSKNNTQQQRPHNRQA